MTSDLTRPNKSVCDETFVQIAIACRRTRANINNCVAAGLRVLSTDATPSAKKSHALILELQHIGDTLAQLANVCESFTRDTVKTRDHSRTLQQAHTPPTAHSPT